MNQELKVLYNLKRGCGGGGGVIGVGRYHICKIAKYKIKKKKSNNSKDII